MQDKEFYCWYDPNTGKCGTKYTLRQLLYTFYEEIAKAQTPHRRYSWRTRQYIDPEPTINIHHPLHMDSIFLKIGHCDNDVYSVEPVPSGYYVTEFIWKIEPSDTEHYLDDDGNICKGRKYQYAWRKFVRYPYIKKFKSRIIDSYGRTISSGYLRALYKQYKPSDNDKLPVPIKKVFAASRYSLRAHNVIVCGYKFRNGPVPGISGHWMRGRGWSRYNKSHCGIKPWKRDWYSARKDSREIREEYGITFKCPDKAPYPYHRTHQRGWKRTKKRKQWM